MRAKFVNEAIKHLTPRKIESTDLDFKSVGEAREFLLNYGFKNSYPYNDFTMVQYTDSKNRLHQLYINKKKPNQISFWRINRPGSIQAECVVGTSIGGKGHMRAFPVKKLITKSMLDNYISDYDK